MRQLGWWATALVAGSVTGCWKTEFAQLSNESVVYSPSSIGVPAGWIVSPIETPLECPDGERSQFYLVHPEASGQPMPVAVVYTSGAFDYVYAADPQDPLGGAHYATPARLGRDWSILQVFTTLGMYPVTIDGESHEGTLVAQLANAGVASFLPANCWGDLWHNAQGAQENQFAAPNGDYFFRNGRNVAEWGYRFLAEPAFAGSQGVSLPITPDPDRLYAIGLGEGARAVGELLNLELGATGTAQAPRLAGAMVDSPIEDLHAVYADPSRYAATVSGLNRIFPGGEDSSDVGALFTAPTLPERMLYLFDPDDPNLPNGAHGRMIARLEAGEGFVWPVTAGRHPLSNAGDTAIADAAIAYLLNGTPPPVTFTGLLDTGN